MTALLVLAAVLAQAAPPVSSPVLERGIAAEMAARWDDALIVYLDSLSSDPRQPMLWLRVADIQARLGQDREALRALEQAAAMDPASAATHYRLSRAYAAANRTREALQAIERALALSPDSTEYLEAHATLATWDGRYGRAQESYRRLRTLSPADTSVALRLARVSAWAGATDEAAASYRTYLEAHPGDATAWLELARAESWRGNVPAAITALRTYRERFGETPEYAREQAATLARGGRPRAALRLAERQLRNGDADDQLRLSKTIALAAQQRRSEALASLESLEEGALSRPELKGAERFVRAEVASVLAPRGVAYHDSDGLNVQRFVPRIDIGLFNSTRVDGAYERADLHARAGSGLEQVTGALGARHDAAWIGLTQRAGILSVLARAGYASVPTDRMPTYAFGVRLIPSDTFRLSASRDSGFFIVSPRTVGLGLTRVAHAASLEWTPSLTYAVEVDGSIEDLSDGNRRWDVAVAPRRVVARTQRLNLDLGVRARQLGAAKDLSNGYYDPHRYESYAVTAFPYWKLAENTGLAMSLALGVQRDDAWRSFRLGGDAAAEATFGIFERWMLKVNAAMTFNERTESGAFRAYSGGVALVRRF